MRNPFAIDVTKGYRWYTFGWGSECGCVWIKFGPIGMDCAHGVLELMWLGGAPFFGIYPREKPHA